MKALFVGRFQPLHTGHLKVIKNASKKFNKIIIGIGSSQYSNTLKNPFTADERIYMIKKTLNSNRINNYKIVLIPDIHNPPKWVDHILSIISDFDVVITNNSFTKQLFLEKGYFVEETTLYNKQELNGTNIRKKIINGKDWQQFLPKHVISILKEIDGIKRLKDLSKE